MATSKSGMSSQAFISLPSPSTALPSQLPNTLKEATYSSPPLSMALFVHGTCSAIATFAPSPRLRASPSPLSQLTPPLKLSVHPLTTPLTSTCGLSRLGNSSINSPATKVLSPHSPSHLMVQLWLLAPGIIPSACGQSLAANPLPNPCL